VNESAGSLSAVFLLFDVICSRGSECRLCLRMRSTLFTISSIDFFG
jgi:hypothetical protein